METDEPSLNLLRRQTPFICNIRFRCDLPEPPSDPKLLISPLQPEKLARFAITSLERNPKRELTLEPDLGIHVGLMDTSAYSVADPSKKLAPEDLALLEGESDFSSDSKAPKKIRERLRGSKAELSWLMRTSYISNETEVKQRQAATPQIRMFDAANDHMDADEAHLQAAEASFAAAQQAPVHATDPSLTALEVTPVLPDFDRWGDNYVLIDFEGDPTADCANFSKLSPRRRQQLAGEAMVKSYALPGPDRKPFLAYMVQKATNSRDDEFDNDTSREARDGEYEWIREYQYEITNNKDGGASSTYLLHFEGGQCSYLDLNTRMKCSKRTRSGQGSDPRTEFPRPSKITVRKRERTEQEGEASAERLQLLRGVTIEN